MAITSLDKIKEMAGGQEVYLPGWTDEPFVARLKRPSFLGLASKGLIPNSLLGAAQKVFTQSVDDSVGLEDITEVMNLLVKEALVEPSYAELESAGVELTDDQLTAIFQFSQQGVKALEKFRPNQSSDEDNKSSK